jgi:uncharacterized repeat protein (TIGR01451 family)
MKKTSLRLPFSAFFVLLLSAAASFGLADLGLSIVDSPDPVRIGTNLTYSLSVTNRGPDRATNVVVTSILPTSANFVSCTPSIGSYSNDAGTVYCNLGNLNNGSTARVVIVCSPTLTGVITNESSISAVNGSGNRTNAVTTVSPPNRAPEIVLPGPHILPVGATTSFVVYAQDPDHDPAVTITNTVKPTGATYISSNFTWTATVAFLNTTNLVRFVANDQQSQSNSVVTNTTTITVPYDWDGDAMDDGWEWNNFQTLTNGQAGDRDADGQNNFSEYVAGTEPTNAQSRFAVNTTPTGGVAQFVVSWPTAAGRTYTLYRGTNLLVQSFQTVASGLAIGSYTDNISSLRGAYYKLKVTK